MRPTNVMMLVRHDLSRHVADRSGFLWSFVLPLVFAGFFGLVFGAPSDPRDATAFVTVVDLDGGPVAERLVGALEAGRITVRQVTAEERATVENPVRTLVIPSGFSDAVEAGEAVTLRLEKEPDTNQQAALVVQARIVGAIGRLLAEQIARDMGPDAARTPRTELVRLESRYAGNRSTVPSGFEQSVPGNAAMFVMLIALAYGAASLAEERRSGVLRRLASAPVSGTELVAGKIGARLVIAWLQISVFVLAAWAAGALFGIDVGENLLGLWLVLAVFACAVAPLGILIGARVNDPDQAANVGVLTTMAMAGLGGCWWPLEITPQVMQRIAAALPSGWAMRAAHQVVSFGNGLGATTTLLVALLAFGAAGTWLAGRTLRVA